MLNTMIFTSSKRSMILLLLGLMLSNSSLLFGEGDAFSSCQALFEYKAYEGSSPALGGITFSNNSTDTYTDLSWDFGDGNVSSSLLPTVDHFFDNPGKYNVCLTIWDDVDCSSQNCQEVEVIFANGSCAQGDCVYPGDVNLDGAANFYDMIIIGMGFGANGPPRPNASFDFTAQSAPDWDFYTPSGINYKHLDCDGNGTIGAADLLGIISNYIPMQSVVSSMETEGPPIYVQFDVDTIFVDENTPYQIPVTAGIMVGDNKRSAEDLQGMAMYLTYDTTYVEAGSMKIDYNESSFFGRAGETLPYGLDLRGEQQIDLGITRIDGSSANGYGRVATASFIIIHDIIDGRSEPTETATFDLPIGGVKILGIDGKEKQVTLNAVASKIVFAKRVLTNVLDPQLAKKISIFPNPATETVQLAFDGIEGTEIELFNIYGQQITKQPITGDNMSLSVGQLPRGLYLLSVHTPKGVLSKRIILE